MLADPAAPVFDTWSQAIQRMAWTAIGTTLIAASVALALAAARRGGSGPDPLRGPDAGMPGVDPASGISLLPAAGLGDIDFAPGLAAAVLVAGLTILRAALRLGRTGDAWARLALACAAWAGVAVFAALGLSLVVGAAVASAFGLPLIVAVLALVTGLPVVLLVISWLVDQAARFETFGPAERAR